MSGTATSSSATVTLPLSALLLGLSVRSVIDTFWGWDSDTMSGKLGRVRISILALSGMIGVLAVRGLTGFISGSGDSASAIAGVLSPLLVVLSGVVGDSPTSGYRTSATADALAPSSIGIILLVLAGFSWVRSVSLLPVLELDESIL